MLTNASRTSTFDRRLFARRCVACGYDGALLRGGEASRCARCGCDLRERPARSYAEMEGLVGTQRTIDAPYREHALDGDLTHRWLAFLFLSMVFLTTMGLLVAAVMGV